MAATARQPTCFMDLTLGWVSRKAMSSGSSCSIGSLPSSFAALPAPPQPLTGRSLVTAHLGDKLLVVTAPVWQATPVNVLVLDADGYCTAIVVRCQVGGRRDLWGAAWPAGCLQCPAAGELSAWSLLCVHPIPAVTPCATAQVRLQSHHVPLPNLDCRHTMCHCPG